MIRLCPGMGAPVTTPAARVRVFSGLKGSTLGGAPVKMDERGVDIAYSGTKKCLSCPPGLGPLSISERAREVVHHRKSKVKNWYLDLTLVEHYWGDTRTYHHTAPISMNFALREALRLV